MTTIINPLTMKVGKVENVRKYLKKAGYNDERILGYMKERGLTQAELPPTLQRMESIDFVHNAETDKYVKRSGRIGIRITKAEEEAITDFINTNTGERDVAHLTVEQLVGVLTASMTDDKYIYLRVGEQTFSLSPKFIAKYQTIIGDNARADGDAPDSYDALRNALFDGGLEIGVSVKAKLRVAPTGAFFKYNHKTTIDFSRYQVFNEYYNDQSVNCLVYTLGELGAGEDVLNVVRSKVSGAYVPKARFSEICEEAKISICLSSLCKSGKTKVLHYGDKTNPVYEVGLVDEHYFINERTKISLDGLNFWKEVKDGNYLINKQRNKPSAISSFQAISHMFKNKDNDEYDFLKKIDGHYEMLATLDGCNAYVEPQRLMIVEKEQRHGGRSKQDKELEDMYANIASSDDECDNNEEFWETCKFDARICFDSETTTDGGLHKAYLYCLYYEDVTGKGTESFVGEECGYDMLNWVRNRYERPLLIAHNLSYDLPAFYEHLTLNMVIDAGRKIKLLKGAMKRSGRKKPCILTFHDSHCLIPTRLANFGSMFNLDVSKEVMPYELYTRQNIKKVMLPISEAHKHLDKEDIEQFNKNIEEWDIKQTDDKGIVNFNAIEYSRRYCEIDCEVLYKGYMTFSKWIKQITTMDVDNSITLPSLVKQYYKITGCFDDVYELTGTPSKFIRNCLVGGRCSSMESKKIHVFGNLNDLDAVSLYASAMVLFKGFLRGIPIPITTEMIQQNQVEKQDGYFVKILVKAIGKKRCYPLGSYVDSTKTRIFTNEMEGKQIYVDRYALENLIEFQQIEYEIIKGYYYNQGWNTRICKVVQDMVNRRKEMQKINNPIQEVYKLFCNSGYGMLIRKDIETKHNFFTDETKFDNFLSYRYNDITSYKKLGKNYMVTTHKPVSQSYSYPHLGAEVLSYSKRKMAEVMCLAEDNKIDIYYTDTDSMHLPDASVSRLSVLYKEKYNRELIGKDCGQFHCDFSTKNKHYIKGSNIVSTEFICLGKKIYIDRLCVPCRDESGKEYNAEEFHIRMKGVNNKAVHACASRLGMSVIDMYKKKFDDHNFNLEFNLLDGCLGFQTLADFTYTTRSVFSRKLSNEEVDKESYVL